MGCERNDYGDTKAGEEGGREICWSRDSPADCGETAGWTPAAQINGGLDACRQPMEDPTPRAGAVHCWDDCSTWKRPMLEQSVKSCSPVERTYTGEVLKDSLPWEGQHVAAVEDCKESLPWGGAPWQRLQHEDVLQVCKPLRAHSKYETD